MKKLFALLAAALVLTAQTNAAIKLHTIGDSTMATYDENATDKRGWCQFLQSFFNGEFVTVNNRAKSGADTRQFYSTANLWPSVKGQMTAGDYLLIQFAHNDEGTVTYGTDNLEYAAYCEANGLPVPTDKRGTCPSTTYKDYLRLFVNEARDLGVTPVLVAPICRKYFSGNTITRKGQHDLGDSFYKIENGQLLTGQSLPADDNSMDYVYAMQQVAEEMNVPFIDLTAATRDLYLQYGDAQCTELLFCKDDRTHTATLGANLIARLGAQLLKDAGVLADYIDIPTDITASPAQIDMGDVYAGVQQSREVLLTGFGLTPAEGNVTITAGGNLQISVDNAQFGSTAQAAYQGSTLFQRLYLKATYTQAGAEEDSLVITSENTRLVVPVTVNVVSLAGGTPVSATWAIDAKPIPAPVIEGPIAAQLTLSHMVATDTKSDFTDGSTFVRIHHADDSGAKAAWPGGEIDENASRYIDFAVTAPATMDVRVTGISMQVASYSTGTMCFHLNTGMGDDMEGVTTIYEKINMTHATPESLSFTPMLTIPAGETLHVRVLPWHNIAEEKSGKYICLKDVKIEGQAVSPTGVITPTVEPTAKKILHNGQVIIQHNDTKYNILGIVLQ
ncbi:MAG: hypothetical protein J6Q57_07180 [Paraprevotella sp.]|nr:hypothetical protein [Paraprevotella sp.]